MKIHRTPSRRFWTGRRVAITGGTGFLGYHLVTQLRELGAKVRIVGLPPRADHPLLHHSDLDYQFGDVCDASFMATALERSEIVIHTAGSVAMWGPALQRMRQVHVEGTRNVIEQAIPGARIIHTSSIVAVGAARQPFPHSEESPFRLQQLRVDYVHAKRDAEEVARKAASGGRDVVIVNPGYLVGPHDHDNSVMGRLCVRFWKGRVPIAPPGGINLVDVRDVATGHLLAAEHGMPGRRYILGGEDRTFREFLHQLAVAAELRPRGLPTLPTWLLTGLAALAELRARLTGKEPYPSFQHARMNRYYWYCTSDRARIELGYQPRPLAETLADTYAWYVEANRLKLTGLNRWWMRPRLRLPSSPAMVPR